VRLVIFWSFYPSRTDGRQPCQEEAERVIDLFLTQCNTFSHEEAVEYIKNNLWVDRMPYVLPWDADSSKNKKTYEKMRSITDDAMKIITLQLMKLLPNVEKVLILGGRAWDFFRDMFPDSGWSNHTFDELLPGKSPRETTGERIHGTNTLKLQ
jgi:hypothetical protein